VLKGEKLKKIVMIRMKFSRTLKEKEDLKNLLKSHILEIIFLNLLKIFVE